MRTTIRLDDRLLECLKRRAAESGTSVSRLIERAVRLLLQAPTAQRRDRFDLVTFGEGGQFTALNLILIGPLRCLKLTTSSALGGSANPMQLPNINVLIYARRQGAPEHDRCAA